MPVCSTEPNPDSGHVHPLPEKDFNEMINAKMKISGNKFFNCAKISTVTGDSDLIVDERKLRRKYRKASKHFSEADYFRKFKMPKKSAEVHCETNGRPPELSMYELLQDLNRIRRLSAASGDVLSDNLNRIQISDGNPTLKQNYRDRRKSTNSSLEEQNIAEMKSIILDPENSLHSPRQQNYQFPQGKIKLKTIEIMQ